MTALHHGGPAGHSASLLMALAEKGLAYDETRLDLRAFQQHGEAFLAVNPTGQVPVLHDGGRTLTETFFILLYLDERYPDPPLDGRDPRARYAVQKWGKYVETHVAPNLAIVGWAAGACSRDATAPPGLERLPPERRALWQHAQAGFDAEEVAAARAALVKAADRVAEDLAAGPWLAGADFTIADIAVFPHLARFTHLGIALDGSVIDWLGRIDARAATRAALGESGIDVELATMGPERGRWG